jgi:DNA-binding MarR family transcriptional regulator
VPEPAPRRLSLLYQLYLTNQAARSLVKLSMAASDMTGEEYALFSYLYANGDRTLTQASRDLGLPITTLATLLAPSIQDGQVEKVEHPRDRRARLLRLTDAGRARLEEAIPAFSTGYRALLTELEEESVDVESLYDALAVLRAGLWGAVERLRDREAAAGGA